jgi:hypothetical protein
MGVAVAGVQQVLLRALVGMAGAVLGLLAVQLRAGLQTQAAVAVALVVPQHQERAVLAS